MYPDIFDFLSFFGLVLMAIGLYFVYPPLALMVPGVLVFGLGVVGAWQRGKRGGG